MFCCWYVEMLCKFCGNEIEENSVFCAECGKPVENSQAEEPVVEDNGNDEVVAEGDFPVEETFAEPQFDEPVKKSKKKLAGIIAAIVAIILVAVVTIASNVDTVKGFFLKTFGSNEDYFMYVESNAFGSATDEVSEAYGTIVDNINPEGAVNSTIKLNVGESAISLLETSLGSTSDFSWLNTVTFDTNINIKDNIEKVATVLNINGESFVDMNLLMDMASGDTFMAILSLSDKYVKMEEGFAVDEETAALKELLSDPASKEVLPSEKEFDKLLDKYINVIFDNMDEIEKASDVLKINDIEKKYTTLEVKINQQDAVNIASAILETAKNDKELKKYIEDVAGYLEEKAVIDDAGIAYDVFLDSIDSAAKDLEETSSEDGTVSWIDYVDANHEIVGRKIVADNEEIIYYATVRDGKNFAFELEASEVVITGKGTEKGDVINGEFSVNGSGIKLCDIVVTDFKANDYDVKGNIRIVPSSDLLNTMGITEESASVLSIANLALEINLNNSKKSSEVDINLISGEEVFVGFTITGKEAEATTVELPDSSNVYGADEIDKWQEELDFDALIKKVEGLGISPDLIAMIQGLMAPAPDLEDDYDYDLGDDYDLDYDLEDYDFEDYDFEDYDLEDYNLEDYDLEGVY